MHPSFKEYVWQTDAVPAGLTRDAIKTNGDEQLIHKLSSNENLLGPSPLALEAIRSNMLLLNEYQFQRDEQLQEALSAHFNKQLLPTQFITGNGGAELLDLICRAFLEPGDECILSTPTFPAYKSFANLQGAVAVDVPLQQPDFSLDVKRILAAVKPNTKLIFLTNPNNPTGNIIPRAHMDELLRQLPPHVVLVQDEVYHNYVQHPDFVPASELIKQGFPVIGLHSFSKIYGLAGLRLGYAFATTAIANYLQLFRRPFMINTLSMKAAIAALSDHAHLHHSVKGVIEEKEWLYKQLQQLGITYWTTEANFILLKSPLPNKVFVQKMLDHDIMIRPADTFGLPDHARVTIGTRATSEVFIKALKAIL